jgi:hypothetical protein
MQEQIRWGLAGPVTRRAVVELCGWRNKQGNMTPTGRRIAHTTWDKLSTAAQRVLTNHGIIK